MLDTLHECEQQFVNRDRHSDAAGFAHDGAGQPVDLRQLPGAHIVQRRELRSVARGARLSMADYSYVHDPALL